MRDLIWRECQTESTQDIGHRCEEPTLLGTCIIPRAFDPSKLDLLKCSRVGSDLRMTVFWAFSRPGNHNQKMPDDHLWHS